MSAKNYPKRSLHEGEDIVSKNDLEELRTELIKTIKESVTTVVETLKEELKYTFGAKIEALEKETAEMSSALCELDEKVEKIVRENEFLKNQLVQQTKRTAKLEEDLEDRTNRALRKTLVFHNVPEAKNESWEQTTDKLAGILQQASSNKLSANKAKDLVERCHRGKESDNKKGMVHMYVLFLLLSVTGEMPRR